MSNKHPYDDRFTIQAGLQQGLKIAQIAKNIGKDRSTVGRRSKHTGDWSPLPKVTTVPIIVPVPRIPNCRSGCFRGKKQCQTACGRCQEGCPDYRKNSVQTMKSHRLYVMPVTTRLRFAVCAGCSMMPSMLSSSMNRCSQSPGKESPSQSRN